ncbi:MAG: CehA/McbA family metallohydrolase [Acidobacteriota bacterium]
MRFHIVLLSFIVAVSALVPMHAATQAPASADATTITLSGTVTTADKGSYQEHAFDVPAGVTRIDVDFAYDNRGKGTELEVGLFDSQRFRGTSRFSKDHFHLTEFYTTPSYVAGPLPAGTWRLSLGIPSIGAGQSSKWTATIRLSTRSTPIEGLGPVLKSEAGWYVGDLHAHTLHSDGFGCVDPGTTTARGCQPWEVVEAARARHLDFFAITDHNTTSDHADLATLQESLTSMLLLRGQELTTFHGHANVYGTSRPIDFRLGFNGRSMGDVLDDVAHEHALLSINHPGRDTGDSCTGCGWDAPATPWDRIEAMEVINGGVIEGRTAGMPFWYARLNEGHRITAIGGSDDHGARSPRGRIGSPATVVQAGELSERALLDGIRSGRVYVRTRRPEGPRLELTAAAGEATVQMGGIVNVAATGVPVRLAVHASGAAGQRAEIVRNGEVVATLAVDAGEQELSCMLTMAPGQWVHVRLRDAQGITAFTNPVYARSF